MGGAVCVRGAMGTIPLILSLLLHISLLHAKRYSVYRITPRTEDSLAFLHNLTRENVLDFWKTPQRVGQEVHVMANEEVAGRLLRALDERAIAHSLMVDDVEKVVKNQKLARIKLRSQRRLKDFRDGKVDFNIAEYHSFADVINYMNSLALTYPNLVSVQPIGLSHEGRQIPLIKITNKRIAGPKRGVWVDGGIHAREWVSPSTVLYFIHQLINGYEQDPLIRRFVDHLDWFLVPLLNPAVRIRRLDCGGRTSRPPSAPPLHPGVDLNRNFDWFFGQVGSSTDPCSEIYQGSYAFSEPETRAVRDFVSAHPITAFITLHSYSQILMYPFGHQVRTYSNDLDDLRTTAVSAANALRNMYGTVYKVGTGADTLYPASGGSEDWAKGKAGVKYSFLFELRPEEQVWDGFLLPENQIVPTARETWEAVKVIATHSMAVAQPTAAFAARSESCRDHDSLCPSWASGGACDSWPEMRERCPLSCRVCTPRQ